MVQFSRVVVEVLDGNDNAPNFEEMVWNFVYLVLFLEEVVFKLTMCFPVSFQEYKVRLLDKASRGQFVAAVRATDADQNSKLTYGIIGGNQAQVFDIDVNEGIVTLANLRNFDQMSSYNLNLSVSDGIYSAFTKLKVGLVSANSYAPIFEKKSYKVQFAEGQPEGVRIAGKFTIYCHNFCFHFFLLF